MKKNLLTITFVLGVSLTTHHLSAENNKMKWQRIGYIWEGLNTQGLSPAKQQHAQELLDQLIQEITLAWNEKNPNKVVMIKCAVAPCINPNFPASLKALITAAAELQKKSPEGRKKAAQLLKDELKKHEERVQQRKKQREANRLAKGKTAKLNPEKTTKVEKKQKNNSNKVDTNNDVKKSVGANGVFYILPNDRMIQDEDWTRLPAAEQKKLIAEAKKTPYKVRQGAGGTYGGIYYELSNGRTIYEEEWLKMSPANQKKLVDEAKKAPYKVLQGQGGTYYEFPNGRHILEEEWLKMSPAGQKKLVDEAKKTPYKVRQ